MPTVKEALDTIPESMWDALDREVANLKLTRPLDSFTRAEFAVRRGGISESRAQKLIAKLVKAGRVRKLGGGNCVYYQLVK